MNEEKTIKKIVCSVIDAGYHVIVVDDGSTDNTAAIARKHGATVLSNVKNLGAWKATQAGIRFAYKSGYDAVLTMDADGQHEIDHVDKLIEKAKQGADVVIGNCTERGSRGRHIAWRFFKVINRLNVDDITSGFRLYNRNAMIGLASRQATMLEFQCVGILILLRNMKLTIAEVSVPMCERKEGISRIFYSWTAVIYYIFYSSLLSMTKAFPVNKDKFLKNMKY